MILKRKGVYKNVNVLRTTISENILMQEDLNVNYCIFASKKTLFLLQILEV